eukprot:TRINITY_DN14046_c0_g1_i2.p1 TRINITY_DN14046_c0_g1~~TRINITY_DN14046_c0_g1_i2.p1  ORF type:complete len:281 (-),score=85.56 TRINITY_DN14046_c0_g1_i2:260-1102(-)
MSFTFFFLRIRRPPRSTLSSSSAASDVYKRQVSTQSTGNTRPCAMAEHQHEKLGGGYYYAHNQRGEDAAPAPEHKPLTEDEASQVQISATGGEEQGMSKWNTGYHWEERDLSHWAQKRLTEMMADPRLLQVKQKCWLCVDEVTMEGHVSSNVRKGQKLIGYELALTLQWSGHMQDASGDFCVTGRVVVENMAEDIDFKDAKITVFDDKIEVECAPMVDAAVAELASSEHARGDVATMEAAAVPMDVMHKKRELLAKIMKTKGLKQVTQRLEQFVAEIYEK